MDKQELLNPSLKKSLGKSTKNCGITMLSNSPSNTKINSTVSFADIMPFMVSLVMDGTICAEQIIARAATVTAISINQTTQRRLRLSNQESKTAC